MGAGCWVAVSPDGRWAATASIDPFIRVWDLQTGQLHQQLPGPCVSHYRVAFSPRGDVLAAGDMEGRVLLWDLPAGTRRHTLEGHRNQIMSLVFSPDGKILASASGDNTVLLWEVATGTALGGALRGHKNAVTALAFSPDGKHLVSGSRWEAGLHFWDPATGLEERGMATESSGGESLAIAPDGRLLVTGGSSDGEFLCHVWDLRTRKKHLASPVHQHASLVTALDVAPDGTVASSACDGTVCLWNPNTGQQTRPPLVLGPPGGWVCNAVFTPEGRHLVIANRNGTVYVLRLAEAAK
jgi:WD40 repeat protein